MSGDRAEELRAALAAFVPRVMALTGTPGLNLAVVWHDELVAEMAFGVADLGSRTPMLPGTGTRVSSITKSYTALAVMQLAERGILDPAAPVPGVENPLGGRPVTARDLLTHRSGLGTDTPAASMDQPLPLEELLARTLGRNRRWQYGDERPCWSAPVGARFAYSNLGMAVLGREVERLDPRGRSYAAYVRDEILAPLGMDDSVVAAGAADARVELSRGYARFADAYVRTPELRTAAPPADGLVTTPRDHVRFLAAFLRAEPPGIGPAVARQMVRPHTRQLDVATEPGAWYGLGFEIGNVGRSDGWFGHSGAYPFGWWSDGRAYPRQDVAVVVCTNKWDMPRWYNPAATIAPGLIAQYVSTWAADPDRPAIASWAWRRAYAAGMLLADRIAGLVAPGRALGEAEIAAMTAGTRADGDWDADGFAAGVKDLQRNRSSPGQIARFVGSAACGVPPAEQEAITLSLGGRGALPVPAPYWAAAGSQAPTSAASSAAASTTAAQEKNP
jgi:CubicO group peptidase (beta-lactamase class C family)